MYYIFYKYSYRGPLSEFEMELVDLFKKLFGLLEGIASLGGLAAESVPLVADGLAPGVDGGTVVIVQGIELLGNGSDLLHTILGNNFTTQQ